MLFSKKTKISEVIKERRIDYQHRRAALRELRDALKHVAMNGLRQPLDAQADEEDGEGMFLALSIVWWLGDRSLTTYIETETNVISEEECKQEAGDFENNETVIESALRDDPILSELAKDLARQLGLKDAEDENMTSR